MFEASCHIPHGRKFLAVKNRTLLQSWQKKLWRMDLAADLAEKKTLAKFAEKL